MAAVIGLQSRLRYGVMPMRNPMDGTALQPPGCKVLVLGLGGGSVPLFLSHHFPSMNIDVVEIDPVVIRAASEAMGFPSDRWGANWMLGAHCIAKDSCLSSCCHGKNYACLLSGHACVRVSCSWAWPLCNTGCVLLASAADDRVSLLHVSE